jgi:hypothetical protein
MVQSTHTQSQVKTTTVVFNICNDSNQALISVIIPNADDDFINKMNENRIATALGALDAIAKEINDGNLTLDMQAVKAAGPRLIHVDAGEHSCIVTPKQLRAALMDGTRHTGAYDTVIEDQSLQTIRGFFNRFAHFDQRLVDQTLRVSDQKGHSIILGQSLTRSNLPDEQLVAAALIRMSKRQGDMPISADSEGGFPVPSSEWSEFFVQERPVPENKIIAAMQEMSTGLKPETISGFNQHFPQFAVVNTQHHASTPRMKRNHQHRKTNVVVVDPTLFINDGSVS